MNARLIILAFILPISFNASAELQVLETGIQMDQVEGHVERPAGTIWKALKNGRPYQIKYVTVTTTTEFLEDSDGCTWTRARGFYQPSTEWANCDGSQGSATVTLKWPVFPFHVGKQWAYNVDAGRWRTSRECRVENTARVRTMIGVVDTFKIVCNDKWNTRTRYYSPVLGTSVYYERHHRTKGRRSRYEFTGLEIPE